MFMIFKRLLCEKIKRKATVITGDGNAESVVRSSINVPLEFEIFPGTPNTNQLNQIVESVKVNKIALKGPWSTKIDKEHVSINVQFRRYLDLWANVVHIKSRPFLKSSKSNVDFVVIRQNTEGEYSQIEHEVVPGYVEMFKITTQERSKQIAEFAFDYAWRNARTKVTCVHKANIMKMGDGLFLESCREVARMNPNIKFNDLIVDNCAMQLTMKPQQFDVLACPNLYGNIMMAIGSGLIGSSALLAGANYNTSTGLGVFEPAARSVEEHTCASNQSNPSGTLLAACLMLKHIGETEFASKIERCLDKTLSNSKGLTPDIGGSSTTEDLLKEVRKCVNEID